MHSGIHEAKGFHVWLQKVLVIQEPLCHMSLGHWMPSQPILKMILLTNLIKKALDKFEFPDFDGNDLIGLLARAEKLFEI